MLVFAEKHVTHGITLKVQLHTEGVLRKLEHFALHHVREAVDAADAVGDRHNCALRAHLRARIEVLDAVLDEFRDLGRVQLHGCSLSFQCRLEGAELRARRTVDNLVADHDLYAADEGLVQADSGFHLAAGALLQA